MQSADSRSRGSGLPTVERIRIERETRFLQGLGLVYVVQGELSLELDAEWIRLCEGDVLTLGNGAECRIEGHRSNADTIVVRIDAGWAREALLLSGCAPVQFRSAVVDRAGTDAARDAARILSSLASPAVRQPPVKRAAGCLELLALALGSERRGFEPVAPRRRRGRGRVALLEALAKLESEPLHGVSLSRFAARVGLSERQTSRLIQEELGRTFREHLADLRLGRACELLEETDRAVIEVAAEAGYGSLAHFNALFRRRTGSTPTRYRERIRRLGASDHLPSATADV